MTMEDRVADRRSLRTIGALVAGAGLLVLLFGVYQQTQIPPELPMPRAGSDFLSGRVSIDEVGQNNEVWFRRQRERAEASFAATAAMMFGVFLGVAGIGVFAQGSRRVQRWSAYDEEARAEAMARGLKRGLAEDESDVASTPSSASPVSEGANAEARLEKLQSLRARGLVTPDEYESKRKEILADL